jgi:D-proline reductase (dithiol) PrdB
MSVSKQDAKRGVYRSFISYIDRTREFYSAQGYDRPYCWAQYDDAPFTPLPGPLSELRVTLITTASPIGNAKTVNGVLRGDKQVWSGKTEEPPEALFTDDLSWDKETTHTNDVESFLPIRQLRAFAEEGRIGSVAPRFHGVPTDYSQRRTIEQDAPEILRRCREDNVDVALLVPL